MQKFKTQGGEHVTITRAEYDGFNWDEPSKLTQRSARKSLAKWRKLGFLEDTTPMRKKTEFMIMNLETGEIFD